MLWFLFCAALWVVGGAAFIAVGVAVVLTARAHALRSSLEEAEQSRPASADAAPSGRKPAVGVVVVGGDFARSPRMQYHASSMCESGLFRAVRCVGIDEGNRCAEHLTRQACAEFFLVGAQRVPAVLQRSWITRTIARVLGFVVSFTGALWRATAPLQDGNGAAPTEVVVVVQTPPAVPFLLLVHLVALGRMIARLTGAAKSSRVSVVVDFHNFGYTLLEIDRRPAPLVSLYRALELRFGVGDAHFTVADAMRRRLTGADGVETAQLLPPRSVTVLRDCAPSFFTPHVDRAATLRRVRETEAGFTVPAWFADEEAVSKHRPTLALVSATSWTADDDYTLVVDALKAIDARLAAEADPSVRVWLLVTGKGATRERFERQVAAAGFSERVVVSTHYFQSFQTYAAMLALFDAGLCVHRSSSGLDLPMKCVDMFGAGLPVIALDYLALPELVTERSGWRFTDDVSLAGVLASLLLTPAGAHQLAARKAHVVARRKDDEWGPNWRAHALPVLQRLEG